MEKHLIKAFKRAARKMAIPPCKVIRDKTKYTRKIKHKKAYA